MMISAQGILKQVVGLTSENKQTNKKQMKTEKYKMILTGKNDRYGKPEIRRKFNGPRNGRLARLLWDRSRKAGV